MQIGTVAKRIGLSVDAIRFYERSAMLPRPPRTQGGFRLRNWIFVAIAVGTLLALVLFTISNFKF